MSHVLRSKYKSFHKNVKNACIMFIFHILPLCTGFISHTKYEKNWPSIKDLTGFQKMSHVLRKNDSNHSFSTFSS